jgi:hypothetical protein
VTIPTALQVANTYVIWSSASYLYVPTGGIGFVIPEVAPRVCAYRSCDLGSSESAFTINGAFHIGR